MADSQVTAWLRCAGLSRFAPRFAAAFISPNIFLSLAPSDLDALGVDSPADRKRLSDLIADLRRTADLPPVKPPPTRSATLSSVRNSDSRPVLESLSDRNSPIHTLEPRSHKLPSSSTSTTSALTTFLPSTTSTSTFSSRRQSRPSPVMRDGTATVTVCVRKRPLSRKELSSSDRDIVSVNHPDASLYVHELKEKVDLTKYVETHSFSFDNVFGEHVSNASVYEGTARPLVDALFSGGRATCFAYGQTGAGKTFTMAGDGAENPGLYTLAVKDVFDRIRNIESELWRKAEEEGDDDFEPPDPPQVWISFYEIYASRLQDLLNRGAKLECREDANNEVQIVGLTERLCEVEEDVLSLIDRGSSLRSTGTTGANDDSSRSHAVFQIELRDPPSSEDNADTNAIMRESLLRGTAPKSVPTVTKGDEIGRLCFIDLAGSERGSDTASSTRQTRMEGAEINKSLLALKECIRAMDKRKDHTPFRGSKLTQVLKASFLGKNCRTVMIANISPASSNVEHTLNTLRYSDRVKEIKKEKGSSNPSIDAPKSLGSRRATFGHGIGANPRSTRTTYANFPTAAKPPISGTENESPDELSSSQITSQLESMSLMNSEDLDEQPPPRPPRSESSRRSKSRGKVRMSEVQSSANESGKTREPRSTARRRASKMSSLPSRPSLGGTFLPRPPTKLGGGDRAARTISGTRSDRISPSTSPETESDGGTRGRRSSRIRETDLRPHPSPAMTRLRARKLEAMKEEDKSDSLSDSRDEESPSESSDGKKETKAVPRKKASRASNVAESAMKYYQTKKEELPEEDLLFASSDEIAEGLDSGKHQSRLLAVSDKSLPGDSRKSRPKDQPPKLDSNVRKVKSMDKSQKDCKVPNETDLPNGTTRGENSKDGNDADPIKTVIRMHHMQIEELMRLTEADVTLVNAAENGEMDSQEYALKLGVNLSQKLDIIKTLQAKLKTLA